MAQLLCQFWSLLQSLSYRFANLHVQETVFWLSHYPKPKIEWTILWNIPVFIIKWLRHIDNTFDHSREWGASAHLVFNTKTVSQIKTSKRCSFSQCSSCSQLTALTRSNQEQCISRVAHSGAVLWTCPLWWDAVYIWKIFQQSDDDHGDWTSPAKSQE